MPSSLTDQIHNALLQRAWHQPEVVMSSSEFMAILAPLLDAHEAAHAEALRAMCDPAAEMQRYYELLFAVETKCPGETRHQTALRYIRQAEARCEQAQAAKDAEIARLRESAET